MSAIKDVMFDKVSKVEKQVMDVEKAINDLREEIDYLFLITDVEEIEDEDIENFSGEDTFKRIQKFEELKELLKNY